jgi:tetratricopeptide (TPR) repeat protein
MLAQEQSDYPRAERCFDEAAAHFVRAGHAPGAAAVLRLLGELSRRRGNTAEAAEAFERALFLSRDNDDLGGEAYARRALGQLRLLEGKVELACSHFRRALELHRQSGDSRGVSAAYLDLGQALCSRGATDEGLAALREAVKLAQLRAASNDALASALLALGTQLGQSGSLQEAELLLAEAESIYLKLGDKYGVASSRLNRANLLLPRARWAELDSLLDAVEQDCRELSLSALLGSVFALQGQRHQLCGRFAEALGRFEVAIEAFENSGRLRLADNARLSKALLQMELGDVEKLREQLEDLQQRAASEKNLGAEADALQALAELDRIDEDFDAALQRWHGAIEKIEALGVQVALAGALMDRAELRLRAARCRELAEQPEQRAAWLQGAQDDLERCLHLAREQGFRSRLGIALVWRAELYRCQAEPELAKACLEEARQVAREAADPLCVAVAAQVEARLEPDPARAELLYAEAKTAFANLGAVQHLRELVQERRPR